MPNSEMPSQSPDSFNGSIPPNNELRNDRRMSSVDPERSSLQKNLSPETEIKKPDIDRSLLTDPEALAKLNDQDWLKAVGFAPDTFGWNKKKRKSFLNRVANWYFKPKSFEMPLYEVLGIRLVKFLVPTGGQLVKRIFKRPKLDSHDREQLEGLIGITKWGEIGHLLVGGLLFFTFPWPVALAYTGYSVMLQRYNRAKAMKKLEQLPTE